MRIFKFVTALLIAMLVMISTATATVRIEVDLRGQTMHVSSGDGQSYDWPVSTARRGYVTPRGTYGVQRMEAMHRSHEYHNSAMPHSIFFRGGYAIHGTYATGALGRAASHGCVRLSPANAAQLYQMVKAEGASITITSGSADESQIAAADRPHHRRHDFAVAARHRRDDAAGSVLSYAPPRILTPSFDDWARDPDAVQR